MVNGLISGVIVSAMLLISLPLQMKGVISLDSGMLVGYTSMVIALSTIFFGIKTYRDQYSGGFVTFWQAFRIGLSIAMVAALVYAVTWEVYYRFGGDEFIAFYAQGYLDNLKNDGATDAELAAARAELATQHEYYKNPFIRFAVTLTEILPVGIVVTIVSSAILRRREILPV